MRPTATRRHDSADGISANIGQLGKPDAVAGRVAESAVDAVRHVVGYLGELHALGPQLLVGGLAVVGGEEYRAGETLRHHFAHLNAGSVVHNRRSWNRHQHDRYVVLA